MYDDMIQNFALSTSSSFCSNDEFNSDRMPTRLVWITNYKTDVDFPIHVSMDDPLLHLSSPSLNTSQNEPTTLVNQIDLSKLNLDDLLFLLYRLQQTTTSAKDSSMTSPSSSSASSSDILDRQSSSHSLIRRPSFFTLSSIADLPKQFSTRALTKSISSFHSSTSKHLHSPNDVVNKLLQSYQPASHYTYQQSEQYKANLLSHSLGK